MNKGASRKTRKSKALDASYISVDERSVFDMLQYTLEFAQYVNFFGTENKVIANWKSFLLNDPVFIIATISRTDISHFKLNPVSGSSEHETTKQSEQLEHAITGMKKLIFKWYHLLNQNNNRSDLLNELERISQSISEEKTQDEESYTNNSIKDKYENIFGNIVYIKSKASKWFEEELKNTDHHPHIGLILTFLKLFRNVQLDINTLTQKHLDFYFRELLKQKNKTLTAHSAIVSLSLQPGIQNLEIKENDTFEFLFIGNVPIVFRADSLTPINQTQISEVKTLFKNNYQPFGTRINHDNFTVNTLSQVNIMEDGESIQSTNVNTSEYLPATLGETIANNRFSEGMVKLSEIGIVISSPVLMLEKGKQRITLTFKITPESYDKTRNLFNGLVAEEIGQLTRKLIDERKIRQGIISKFFGNAFLLFITDKSGWKRIETFVVKVNPKDSTLSFDVHLSEIYDELELYNIDLHKGNFETEWPCIKIVLNNDAQYQPYKLLKNIIIDDIGVEASVSDVKELQLSNLSGKLDSTIPMQPFGPAPAVGGFFAIHNSAILQEYLSCLELLINWSGLPQIRNGFENYYRDYPFTIENNSFKAVITQNKNEIRNSQTTNQQNIELFEMDGDYLTNKLAVKVNLDFLTIKNQKRLINVGETNNSNPLYFVLTEPATAFGHQIYPEIYAEAALKSSKPKKSKIELPAQPFTPIIEHLVVNYSNSVREMMHRKQDVNDSKIKLFHIHPFGHVQAFPGPVKAQNFLFPQINYTGHLFLGLQNTKPNDIVSVGFDLVSAVYKHTAIYVPRIEWQYLLNNDWVSLNDLLLEDGTNGLLQSGIVKIQFPKIVQTDNTSMPAGKFWLRAIYDGVENLNSKIKKIFTQAVLLSSNIPLSELAQNEREPNSIEKISALSSKGIDKISGPFNLVISESVESEESFYNRVSEQMRHKNRAVSNWDIERIILDKFKQIDKVRVYGRSSHPNELVKGCDMQIVLIPINKLKEGKRSQSSSIDISTLLKVKQYVSQFVSPYVKIEVSNPMFEYLKVRCSVKFNDIHKSGHYRNVLNNDLVSYLSPDIENEYIEKGFDESISKAEIQNYIESRPYVDFVTQFSVLQLVAVQDDYRIIDSAKIQAINNLRTITPYAILTSASSHQIDILKSEESLAPSISGVGDLGVGIDFIISDNEGKYI